MAIRKPASKSNATQSRALTKVRPVAAPAAGQYSRNNPQYSHAAAKKKAGRGKKIALAVVCAVLVLFIGAGTAVALYVDNLNRTLAGDRTQEEWDEINDALVTPPTSSQDPFYMLLVGSDAREGDTASRSDTNILVRVDPETCTVTMVSIPRDTMIDLDGSIAKFNAAYNNGVDATIREASELTGVDISYFAEVNFEKLISLVDAIGGVEVDVPERIDDPDAGDIIIEEGPQTLNGEAALVFARSRAYADGDFTRTSNQRLLIEGIINKVLSLPVTEMPGVIEKAAQSVTTNMSVQDIVNLALQFKDLGKLTVYSAMVPSWIAPEYVNGASYVIADEEALAEMMKLVEAGEDPSTVEAGATVVWPEFSGMSNSGSSQNYSTGNDTTYSDPSTSGGYVDPGYTDPGYSDPGYVDPGYSDPGYSDPGYTDPGYSDPGYTDPGYSDPGAPVDSGGVLSMAA